MSISDEYLRDVNQLTRQALIQFKAAEACEQHREFLVNLHNASGENAALHVAKTWIEDRRGESAMLSDVREAIDRLLADAGNGECPECARTRSG